MANLLQESLTLEEIRVAGYEKVIKVNDAKSGLQAIICLHDTSLGPALGGTRIYPYATFEEALNDVMRLAKGMTYKSALAETGFGGGKAVIFADPKKENMDAKLAAFGQAVHQLEGMFITAEDVGCSTKDVGVISKHTPYVVGLAHEKSSGNPGPFTAWGTYRGIQSVLKKIYGSDEVKGRTVAVQGLGSVGVVLTGHLFWAGAKLIISDIDWEKTQHLAKLYGAKAVHPNEILNAECDVLAPCAMGGIINSKTIPELRCKAIAGSANNQLLKDSDADELMKRGILYAPDFIINAGGLINVVQELRPEGYNPSFAQEKIHALYDQLLLIYDIADQNKSSTHAAAVSLGDYRLKYKIGKREIAPCFHHSR